MHFIILLLLTMPSLSIVASLGLPYLPNEKISFFIILFLFFNNMYKIELSKIIILLFFSISILLIIISHGIESILIAEINTVYFFIALIFYIAYFKKFGNKIIEILPKIVLIQILVSVFQQISMIYGFFDYAMLFNNYPPQDGYIYASFNYSLFRTSGLFNESSQYAVFLLLYIILFFNNFIKKSKFNNFVLLLSFIDFIITESIIAYIIFAIYILYKIILTREKIYIKAFTIFNIVLLMTLLSDKIIGAISKIIKTMMMEDGYPRLSASYTKITETFENSPINGFELSWKTPSWDIISIYFYAFGFIGIVIILIFLFYFAYSTYNILSVVFLLYIVTNASLVSSLNILIIVISFYIMYAHKNLKLIKEGNK